MNKLKKIVLAVIITLTFFSTLKSVNAGNLTLDFSGVETALVGEEIEVTIRVSNISGFTDGLATAQGDISYDKDYLEFVTYTPTSSNLNVSYGKSTHRFVALGLNGQYITSSDNLFTMTFKVKKVGETVLNISDVIVGDTKSIQHGSSVIAKKITITEKLNNDSTSQSSNVLNDNTNDNNSLNQNSTNLNNNDNSSNNSDINSSSKDKTSSTKNSTDSKEKSSDDKLTNLIIRDAKMSPEFSPDKTTYDVTVANNVSKLDLDYLTSDSKANVSIVGNANLKDDQKNVVQVVVTAEDGSTKTYTLNVTKSTDKSHLRLISLEVKESELSKDFDKDCYEYAVTIPKNTNKLTIKALPEQNNVSIDILGNENLENGNVVLIKLTDKKGYNSYYRINVNTIDDAKKLFGINIRDLIIYFIILLVLLALILLFILWKRNRAIKKALALRKQKNEAKLKEEIVTKDEIIRAIKEKDPKKLKMLLKQDEINQLKEELKNCKNLYNDLVTKDEIIDAIKERNTKKLKIIKKQEEVNKLKDELKKRKKNK